MKKPKFPLASIVRAVAGALPAPADGLKILAAFLLAFAVLTASAVPASSGTLPALTGAQGLFRSYLDGAEEAKRRNWEDLQMYNIVRRQQLINEALAGYHNTGNLSYLCLAAAYGHSHSAMFLYQQGISCR